MVTVIDVEKVEFPKIESSTLFWVTVKSESDLREAAEKEGVGVIYRDGKRLYFVKGCLGLKYTP